MQVILRTSYRDLEMGGRMFSAFERQRIRLEIINTAKADARICGGAITGSASVDNEDAWSDIDLAFGVLESVPIAELLNDFSKKMYRDYEALHHLDVVSGAWIYRVFFLADTLQVDIAFAPISQFGARASTFKLLFGVQNDVEQVLPQSHESLIGYAWLYALHSRSSIARARFWQAEYFISLMRDQVFALSCLRFDLPDRQGRGIDNLPSEIKTMMQECLVKSIESNELVRAFQACTKALIQEIHHFDKNLISRLEPSLSNLANRCPQ